MTTTAIQSAFRFHMRNNRPAFYYAHGYNGRNAWPEKAHGIAREALARARADVASGKARYPAPVRVTWQEECEGLRLVGRVATEPGGRNGYFSNDGGWYTDPHGDVFEDDTGLCYGVVYQLAARNGHARFVAGYQFGGVDGGPTLDFKRIYVAERAESEWLRHDAADCPAVRKACHAADAMAEKAAESEREYQTAWRAGSDYAQEAETIAEARQEALAILSERRAVKGKGNYPALCAAIRSQVESLLETIAEARAKRADLANGDADGLYFWTGDKRLQDAFCEGADVPAPAFCETHNAKES